MFKTTEVTSYEIDSDNVLNQRLFFAYLRAGEMVKGNLLEVGCGTGKGIAVFEKVCDHYTAIDKNDKLTAHLKSLYPQFTFINQHIPPFKGVADHTFDTVVTLQVIEHIEDDHLFLKEIYRVLKPGGKAIIATPNIKLSLSRNPWHVREYTADQLSSLLGKYFDKVDFRGVLGNQKVMDYHEENRRSVARFTRFDIFNLQYRLPRTLLQIPYEILNRMNRKALLNSNNDLVKGVTLADFSLSKDAEKCLDFFCIVEKKP